MAMRWLIWPRQYGKTTRVIDWWLDDPANRVIVTASEELARHHRRKAQEMYAEAFAVTPEFTGHLRNNIMSWRSWPNAERGRRTQQVALDDCVKLILSGFVGVNHELAVISDAGRVEDPDFLHAQYVEQRNNETRQQYGRLHGPDWDPGIE